MPAEVESEAFSKTRFTSILAADNAKFSLTASRHPVFSAFRMYESARGADKINVPSVLVLLKIGESCPFF